jgi:hypothetical protein
VRFDQWYYIRITDYVYEADDPIDGDKVLKFQWARQSSDKCANLDADGYWVVSWSGEITIDTAVTDHDYIDIFKNKWWKVVIENNVSVEFNVQNIIAPSDGYTISLGPYFLEMLRYGNFCECNSAGINENGLKCLGGPNDQEAAKCGCPKDPRSKRDLVFGELLNDSCDDCGLYENYPTILGGDIVSDPPDIDSVWPNIRTVHGVPTYTQCNCLECD